MSREIAPVLMVPSTLLAATLAVSVAVAVAGAGPTKAQDGQDRPAIQSLKGDKYRMASARMAANVTRYADPAGDQASLDGSPATGAPDWSDIAAVYVAPTRMPAKLVTKMNSEYPPGTSGSFYGEDYSLRRKDRVVFVAVEMAGRLPARARGQQVEVGFSGSGATPVQVGSQSDPLAGLKTFSLGGLFSNGAYGTGTTDISGRAPGAELAAADYYDAEAGTFGFYSPARETWYLVVPRAGDTDTITVSVRSTTDEGHVIDRLDLPGGGHFVDLRDPTGGFTAKGSLTPLTCRALETFSGSGGLVELADPAATLIRYTAGSVAGTPAGRASELVAAAAEAAGPVPVVLTPVDSEEAPVTVDGELAISDGGDIVTLSVEAPPGQWSFALADELVLLTPAGERIVDHTSLTGTAGVRTGADLDGTVVGDPGCGAGSAEPGSDDPDASPAPSESPASEDGTTVPAAASSEASAAP